MIATHDCRTTLRLLGAGLAATLLPGPARAAAPLDRLDLRGPPAGPSVVLAHTVATGRLTGIAE